MKIKCEEIVIDRYLKGSISNEFKEALLWVINARRDNGPYLEILFKLLKDDSQEKLGILETIVNMIKKQVMEDSKGVRLKEPRKLVDKLIKELENDLSK